MSEYEFEVRPFLEPGKEEVLEELRQDDNGRAPAAPEIRAEWYQAKSPGAILALISLMLFCLVVSALMAAIPSIRLLEDVVCRRHYGSAEPVDEQKCKGDEIQAKIAWLSGLRNVLSALVGMCDRGCRSGPAGLANSCSSVAAGLPSLFRGAFSRIGAPLVRYMAVRDERGG